MFDDWDIDEDTLQDFMDDEIFGPPDKEEDDVQLNIKRRKINDELNPRILTAEPNNEKIESKNDSQSLSRTNTMLAIFNKYDSERTENKVDTEKATNQHSNSQLSHSIIDESSRRNKVLEILTKSQLTNISNNNMLSTKENSKDSTSKLSKSVKFTKDSNQESKKRNSALAVFKTPKSKETKKSPEPHLRPALVRKFPGPAGLLPDEPDPSVPLAFYINLRDENDNDHSGESGMSDFCSQNTKNLFTAGAWQHMLDDLPADFLEDFEISMIKKNAKADAYENNKVPFLAGIVQFIDYQHNNPKIILKDISDEIEGHLHCEIPKLYPNVLDCGIVMLLRDVGLIINKWHFYAMISPKNIVSIYSEKARIVSTPHIKSILELSSKVIDQQVFEDESPAKVRRSDIKISEKEIEESIKPEKGDKYGSEFCIDFEDEAFFGLEDDINEQETNFFKDSKKENKSMNILKFSDQNESSISMSSVKMKLLKFKNNDDDSAELSKKATPNIAEHLFDSDDDLDNDIFSQLDMDSIMAEHCG